MNILPHQEPAFSGRNLILFFIAANQERRKVKTPKSLTTQKKNEQSVQHSCETTQVSAGDQFAVATRAKLVVLCYPFDKYNQDSLVKK